LPEELALGIKAYSSVGAFGLAGPAADTEGRFVGGSPDDGFGLWGQGIRSFYLEIVRSIIEV